MEKSGPPALATEAYRITSLPPGWLGTGARFQNPPPATTATVTASTTACVSRPLSRDRRGVTSGVIGRASVKAGSGDSGVGGRGDSGDPDVSGGVGGDAAGLVSPPLPTSSHGRQPNLTTSCVPASVDPAPCTGSRRWSSQRSRTLPGSSPDVACGRLRRHLPPSRHVPQNATAPARGQDSSRFPRLSTQEPAYVRTLAAVRYSVTGRGRRRNRPIRRGIHG